MSGWGDRRELEIRELEIEDWRADILSARLFYNAGTFMIRILLRIWRVFPLWVHMLVARIVRPRFLMAVAALVFDEQGRILLFKHTYRKLAWGIPAGGLEYGERPQDAIIREFFEETGMTIEVQRLLFADSSRHFQHVSLIYLCGIIAGEFKESYEISEIKYFDVDDLPPMLLDEKNLIRNVVKILQVDKLIGSLKDTGAPDFLMEERKKDKIKGK